MSSRKDPDNWISISVGTLYPCGHISREGAPPSVNIFKPLPHNVSILVGTTAHKVDYNPQSSIPGEYSAKARKERGNTVHILLLVVEYTNESSHSFPMSPTAAAVEPSI